MDKIIFIIYFQIWVELHWMKTLQRSLCRNTINSCLSLITFSFTILQYSPPILRGGGAQSSTVWDIVVHNVTGWRRAALSRGFVHRGADTGKVRDLFLT